MGTSVPFRQFVLKLHSRCDLACDHCYMYEHADQSWRSRPHVMSSATITQVASRIAEHARRHRVPGVTVVFHGGEPLLAGPERLAEASAVLRQALAGICALDLRIHTNAVLLDDGFCEVFREHGIRVGISLDGNQASNDRHRRYANGRSSYAQVIHAIGLVRERIPELFAGLLCTIDVRNDPLAVYRELAAHDPPAIDFLLPHATWDSPPYRPAVPCGQPGSSGQAGHPIGAETAYASWLAAIFDAWLTDGMPMPVRMFDSIIQTSHGGGTLTESLGLEPSDLLVIETDGTLEQADSLKTAYEGAPATGCDVFTSSLDTVAEYPGILARQRGLAGLAAQCRACTVVETCGGGLYAHRYGSGSFAHPSVYCADLLAFIGYVRDRTRPAGLIVPGAVLDVLATGYGGADELGMLAGTQRTMRRALVAAIPEAARDGKFDGAAQDGPAWALLSRLDRTHRDVVDAVLGYPYVRVWATRCLRGQAEAADLVVVAAAAAIRAGADARLELPVRAGLVHLPGIGSWRVDKTAGTVPIEISDGTAVLPVGSGAMPLRALTAGPVSIVLDDLDPYRDCYGRHVAGRLADDELTAWQHEFGAAWQLIERDYPKYAPGLAAGLSAIVPLAPTDPGRHASATARDAFGAVAIARPGDPAVLALLLMHEFQHVKLGAVLDVLDLHDAADTGLYYAPWRDDPRPLEGLLQGTYAHIAVADYWRIRRLTAGTETAASAFARWREQTMAAIDTLAAAPALTEVGRRFVDGMRITVTGWLTEPVPDAARVIAERETSEHRHAWLAAHGRPRDEWAPVSAGWPLTGVGQADGKR
jgi:uncharacterized protein